MSVPASRAERPRAAMLPVLRGTTSSTGAAMSTTMPASSASSGSSVASWDSSRAGGMKWPVRPSVRARRTSLLPCRCRKTTCPGPGHGWRRGSCGAGLSRRGPGRRRRVGKPGADCGQPGPAVLVGQGRAGRHLSRRFPRGGGSRRRGTGRRARGHEVADGGLAAAGHAHHDDAVLAGCCCHGSAHQSWTVPSTRRL
jgi:hypothetical protein